MKTSAGIYCRNHPDSLTCASGYYAVILALLLVALVLLAACTSGKRHDYTYQTKGSADYTANVGEKTECMASWYGKDFHGRPTASGEIFNMYDLTCAHKVYPLGTRVKVTHISNGKEVECLINDRGPFIAGRDLDLSYGAAKKIDLIGPGVGRVRIEVLGRESRYIREVKYGRLDGSEAVTIQAGSFRDEENAKRLKMDLELNYKDVYIMTASVGKERYYRVRIGKFRDRAEALKVAGPMAEEGYSVLVSRFEKQI
jgi:rare lipoprotein A